MAEAEWLELYRVVDVTPLATTGNQQPQETLAPGTQVRVIERLDGDVLVGTRGGSNAHEWHYLIDRAQFEQALTPPDGAPREGQARTSPATTAGSPD